MNRRRNPVSREANPAARPLTRKGARRRVRTRTALFLCLLCAVGMALVSLVSSLVGQGARVWLGAAASLAFFALPAYLGLCELDGDQRHLLQRRKLSGGQALWLAASGALLVCPATLLGDVLAALAAQLTGAFGAQVSAAAVQSTGSVAILPILLASGVIAPLCEELFFRGYLLGALARYGTAQSAAFTAAVFAVVHGLGFGTPVYLLLGLLLAVMALRTHSVLGSALMHMAYNVTVVLLAATPLAALFTGLTPLSCIVRLLGCAALCYTAKRAWLARGVREAEDAALTLTKREIALLLAAAALVVLSQCITGVTG